MSRQCLQISACWMILAFVAHAAETPASREWQVAGVARTALVYAPAKATQTLTPVVFVFHGHGGTAKHAARTFAIQTLWPEAVAIYMQGLNTPGRLTDPEGLRTGWQHAVGDQQDRDLKFFDAVLKSLKSDFRIDERRIYSTGHSNGGAFTYLLWAQRADVFAAVAPSAATAGQGWRDLTPKPALQVAGENDTLVKFQWQQSAMGTIRKLNRCAETGKPWAKAGPLVGTIYASETHTPFVAVIHPGGHQFPPEAPGLIVKFFQEHQLDRADSE